MRETLVKLLFLCNSFEEGQGETKRFPSVWPDHQHIPYPSCRPAPPPQAAANEVSVSYSLQYATR